jgi:hypothetical protein
MLMWLGCSGRLAIDVDDFPARRINRSFPARNAEHQPNAEEIPAHSSFFYRIGEIFRATGSLELGGRPKPAEPTGRANRPKPVRTETNRTETNRTETKPHIGRPAHRPPGRRGPGYNGPVVAATA